MNHDLIFVSCLLVCGFLFGVLCSAAFYVHTPDFAEQAKTDCKNKGFYNLEENQQLSADYNACSYRLAQADLNLFYCEKYCKKDCNQPKETYDWNTTSSTSIMNKHQKCRYPTDCYCPDLNKAIEAIQNATCEYAVYCSPCDKWK
jgi:hypothetical protein